MWYWAVAMDSLCGKEGGDRERRETHAEREREPFFFFRHSKLAWPSAHKHRDNALRLSSLHTHMHPPTHTRTQTHAIQQKTAENNSAYSIHTNRKTQKPFFPSILTGEKACRCCFYKQLDTHTKITMPKEEKTMTDGVSWTIWLSSILCHTHLWQIECIPVSWRSESKSQYGHLGQEVASHSRCACLQIQLEWVYILICSAHKDGHHFMNFQKILHL